MACHPILSPDARSALTLKLVCGLSTDDVARAFLTPAATIAQRIVRAKRTLAAAKVRFELPPEPERPARLDAVREVIYLVFNEGHSATSGDQWFRGDLCAEALRLGRMLAALTPSDTETLGLLALIEIQASRLRARTGPDGEPVLLLDQDRTRWDRLLIQRGLANIDRIEQLGGTVGPYALQAAIAACHARATRRRGHRLGADHRAVRRPGPDQPVAGRRAQPRGRDRAGVRPGGGPGDRAAAVRRPGHARLPPAARPWPATCCAAPASTSRPASTSCAPPRSRRTAVERTTMQRRAAAVRGRPRHVLLRTCNRWLRKSITWSNVMCNQTLQEDAMEFGTIEREIYVEASPEVVFEVVSSPEHLKEWWPDDARYEPPRRVRRGRSSSGIRTPAGQWCRSPSSTRSRPGRSRSAGRTRPTRSRGEGNSLLVTFDLTPSRRRHPAQDDRVRLPRDGLGGRRARGAVPRARHRLGLLPAAAGAVRRATGVAAMRPPWLRRSTTSSGRRSVTRPGAGCSTCCSSTDRAPRPR